MMKHKTGRIKRFLSLLLCSALLFTAVTANAAASADAQDVTVNHSDSLSRLLHDKPAYCLFCGELHEGVKGSVLRFFHEIAYFFCGIVGKYPDKGRMYFTGETLEIGADEPFYFIHAGDTHVGFIDERDSGDERLVETAKRRERDWPAALRTLDDLSVKAKELDALIVHTGDLIDFVSERNLDYARDFTANNDVFACAGNHEYHIYIWDDGEDAPRTRFPTISGSPPAWSTASNSSPSTIPPIPSSSGSLTDSRRRSPTGCPSSLRFMSPFTRRISLSSR